jgi:hypothetical protein
MNLKPLCYYLFQSSRAATILWGRMASCGRLAIGLLVAHATLEKRLRTLRLSALPYYLFQSSRTSTILYHRKQIAEAMWGGLAKPAADCQNRPAALWGRLATCGGLSIRLLVARATLKKRLRSLQLAALWGRLAGVPSGSGGLSIRLLVAHATLKKRLRTLRLSALWSKLAGAPSGSGGLSIRLPLAPDTVPAACRYVGQPILAAAAFQAARFATPPLAGGMR